MPTYYEILEVDPNADSGAIRKAYLKASLKYHPDKNPDDVESAKAKFVEVGRSYECLSDPQKRAIYDRELRSGRTTNINDNYDGSNAASSHQDQEEYYENYRHFFDANVAGMSEAELAAAVGTAAAVAGMVGSIVGSRMLGGSSRSRGGGGVGSSFLGAAGSVVGSMVASEIAASSVRALHQQSIERIAYKEECRRCVERGEPVPDPPESSGRKVEQAFQKAVDAFRGVTGTNNNNNNNSTHEGGTRSSFGNLWQQAREGVRQATQAAEAANSSNGGSRTSGGSGASSYR